MVNQWLGKRDGLFFFLLVSLFCVTLLPGVSAITGLSCSVPTSVAEGTSNTVQCDWTWEGTPGEELNLSIIPGLNAGQIDCANGTFQAATVLAPSPATTGSTSWLFTSNFVSTNQTCDYTINASSNITGIFDYATLAGTTQLVDYDSGLVVNPDVSPYNTSSGGGLDVIVINEKVITSYLFQFAVNTTENAQCTYHNLSLSQAITDYNFTSAVEDIDATGIGNGTLDGTELTHTRILDYTSIGDSEKLRYGFYCRTDAGIEGYADLIFTIDTTPPDVTLVENGDEYPLVTFQSSTLEVFSTETFTGAPFIADSRNYTLSFTTDEEALCRYGVGDINTSSFSYDQLPNNISSGSPTLSHSVSFTPDIGAEQFFYLACVDAYGNEDNASQVQTVHSNATTSINITFLLEDPSCAEMIPNATDVPADNGGSVELVWGRNVQDNQDLNTVTDYAVYRIGNETPGSAINTLARSDLFTIDEVTYASLVNIINITADGSATYNITDGTTDDEIDYYYYILAFHENESIDNSENVILENMSCSLSTSEVVQSIDNEQPLAISNLFIDNSRESLNGSRMALNWTLSGDDGAGADDVTNYTVFRQVEGTDNELNGIYDAVYNATTNGISSFVDTGLNASLSYCYIVMVTDNSSLSTNSSKLCANPNAQPYFINLTFTPTAIKTNDSSSCTAEIVDIDGDSLGGQVNVTWTIYHDLTLETTLIQDVANCSAPISPNNPSYSYANFTSICSSQLDSANYNKADTVSCTFAATDGIELAINASTGDEEIVSSTISVNNTAPTVSVAAISPSNPDGDSNLFCNYTFFDIDGDVENTSLASFKWFSNNDGLNSFVEILGQYSQTLSSSFIDQNDIVICSVRVHDSDSTYLNSPLPAENYTNSSSVVVTENSVPQVINYSATSVSGDEYTLVGDDVLFSVGWLDTDVGETAQLYVCDEFSVSENQESENYDSVVEFGDNSSNIALQAIFYTNETGRYVNKISVYPIGFEREGSQIYAPGSTVIAGDADLADTFTAFDNFLGFIDSDSSSLYTKGEAIVNDTDQDGVYDPNVDSVVFGETPAFLSTIVSFTSSVPYNYSDISADSQFNASSDFIYVDLDNSGDVSVGDLRTEGFAEDSKALPVTTYPHYDLLVYEVDSPGESVDGKTLIARDNNLWFTLGVQNHFNPQYNAQPLPNKYLAFVFCIDSDDDDTCDSNENNLNESIQVQALTSAPTSGEVYIVNDTSTVAVQYNPRIIINYEGVGDGSCLTQSFCNTTLLSNTSLSCTYTALETDNATTSYSLRVCDSSGSCSVERTGTFIVNHIPQISTVVLGSDSSNENIGTDNNLMCAHGLPVDESVFVGDFILDADGSQTIFGDIRNSRDDGLADEDTLVAFTASVGANLSWDRTYLEDDVSKNKTATEFDFLADALIIDLDADGTYNATDIVIYDPYSSLQVGDYVLPVQFNETNLSFHDSNSDNSYTWNVTSPEDIIMNSYGFENTTYNEEVTFSFLWYVKPFGFSNFTPANNFSWYDNDFNDILTNGNTVPGDEWLCQVTITDQYNYSNQTNSTAVTIGNEGDDPSLAPVISSVTDNSNATNPTTIGSTLEVTVTFSDPDSNQTKIYLCDNSTIIRNSGCFNKEFARAVLNITANNLTTVVLNYTMEDIYNYSQQNYTLMICDPDYHCSDVWESNVSEDVSFYANIAPVHQQNSPIIVPSPPGNLSSPYNYSTLNNFLCNISWSDEENQSTVINDPSSATFSWYRNRTGEFVKIFDALTTDELSNGVTEDGDQLICEVILEDALGGFSDPKNSSVVVVGSYVDQDNTIPQILSVSSSALQITPVNYGENLSLAVYWSDFSYENLTFFICNSTDAGSTGCNGLELARTSSGTSPTIMEFAVDRDDVSGFLNMSDYTLSYTLFVVDSSENTASYTSSISLVADDVAFNYIPIVENVTVTGTDSLTCTYDYQDLDDPSFGNSLNSSFYTNQSVVQWYNITNPLNPIIYTNVDDQNIVPASVTTGGEIWVCEVTPYDGYVYGSIVNSSSYEVGQTRPVIESYQFLAQNRSNPDQYYTIGSTTPLTIGQNFSIVVTWSDPNDATTRLYVYSNDSLAQADVWYDTGSFVTDNPINGTFNSSTLSDDTINTNVGNISNITFRLADETGNVSLLSTNSSSNIIYTNRVPQVNRSLSVDLVTSGTVDYYSCNANISDNDTYAPYQASLASSLYTWYVDDGSGFVVSGEITGQTLPLSAMDVDEEWICQLTPFDGYEQGTAVNSSIVTQLSSIPEITSVVLNSTANGVNLGENTATNPVKFGENISLSVTVADANLSLLGDNFSLFVCDNQSANQYGCTDSFTWCSNTTSNTSPILCEFNTSDANLTKYTNNTFNFTIIVYDENDNNSTFTAVSNFTIDQPVVVSEIAISPAFPLVSEALVCNYNLTDNDTNVNYNGTNETPSFRWFKENSSGVFLEPYTANTITPDLTSGSDKWTCEATPINGTIQGDPVNSSTVTVGQTVSLTSRPTIFNITTNSNSTKPVTAGEDLIFTINWLDAEYPAETVRVIICESENIINNTGCLNNDGFINEDGISTSEVNVTYTTTSTDSGNTSFYAMVCDELDNCSDIYNSTNEGEFIYIDNLPTLTATSPVIVPSPPGDTSYPRDYDPSSNLLCNISWTDDDLGATVYNEDENATFSWYVNGTLLYENITDPYLTSANVNVTDVWVCEVTLYSGYGINNSKKNSSEVTIGDYITSGDVSSPIILNVTTNVNQTLPVNYNEEITFSIDWTGFSEGSATFYLCNSTSISQTGCIDHELGRVTTQANPALLTVNISTDEIAYFQNTSQNTFNYSIFIIDSSQQIISYNETFSTSRDDLSLNYPPEVDTILINGTNEFSCNYTLIDYDDTSYIGTSNSTSQYSNATAVVRWYNVSGGTGPFDFSAYDDALIASQINDGEVWVCEVTPYDEYVYGTPVNSSFATVGSTAPRIINFTVFYMNGSTSVEMSATSPIPLGENVFVNVSWFDPNDTTTKLRIQNNETVPGGILYYSTLGFSSENPITGYLNSSILRNTSNNNGLSEIVNNISFRLEESTGNASNWSTEIYNSSIYLNEVPEINGSVATSILNVSGNLYFSCDVNISDNDTISTYLGSASTSQYRWFVDDSTGYVLSSESSSQVSLDDVSFGERWVCEVTPCDSYSCGTPLNSSYITEINETPEILSLSLQNNNSGTLLVNNLTQPLVIGQNLTFTLNWQDSNLFFSGEEVTYHICENESISTLGCTDSAYTFCSNTDTTGEVNCTVNSSTFDLSTYSNNTINYTTKLFDSFGNESAFFTLSQLYYDRAPEVGSIAISPVLPINTTNLFCNVSITDQDTNANYNGTNETPLFTWYKNVSGTVTQTGFTQSTLTNDQTNTLERWLCQATPVNGTTVGTPVNSSWVIIGDNNSISDTPSIVSVLDNSNETSPVNAGDDVLFSITWTDAQFDDGESVRVIICNDENIINNTGCVNETYVNFNGTLPNPIVAVYPTTTDDVGNNSYYIMVCDDSDLCSEIYNSTAQNDTFYVNTIPEVSGIDIEELTGGNLYCNYTFSDNNLSDIFYTDQSVITWYTAQGTEEYCGDGVLNGLEQCELLDNGDTGYATDFDTCFELGFVDGQGSLSCDFTSCTVDTSLCVPATGGYCGDGVRNTALEQCDGSANGDFSTCSDIGSFTGGTLGCNADCTYNVSQCVGGGAGFCGNGILEFGEDCEVVGSSISGTYDQCSDISTFIGGTLSCSNCEFDTSQCIEAADIFTRLSVVGQTLPSSAYQSYEKVLCQVSPSDGFANGTLELSSLYFGISETPEITSVLLSNAESNETYDENAVTNPVLYGTNATLNITWDDFDLITPAGENVSLYVCDSNSSTSLGCLDTELCSIVNTNETNQICEFNTSFLTFPNSVGTSAVNLSSFSSEYKFIDSDGDGNYSQGEVVVNSTDQYLDNLSEVLINATATTFANVSILFINTTNSSTYNSTQAIINSSDLILQSTDEILRSGVAFTSFTGTERYNCTLGPLVNASCFIVNDSDSDGVYNDSVDTILYNGSSYGGSLVNLSILSTFPSEIRYVDSNIDTVYTLGEAVVNSSDSTLSNASQEVIVNATTQTFSNVSALIIDTNLNSIYDINESMFTSSDLLFDTNDTIVINGTELTNFSDYTKFRCETENASVFNSTCFILNDTNNDSVYNASDYTNDPLYSAAPYFNVLPVDSNISLYFFIYDDSTTPKTSSRLESLYLNSLPDISNFSITTFSGNEVPIDADNLYCNFTLTDPDGAYNLTPEQNETNSYVNWYYQRNSTWNLFNNGKSRTVSNSFTQLGDEWVCELIYGDGYHNSSAMNSSSVLIQLDSYTSPIPNITEVTLISENEYVATPVEVVSTYGALLTTSDNSTNVGDNINFSFVWEDVDQGTGNSEIITVYLCSSDSFASGCLDTTYVYLTDINSSPVSFNYTTEQSNDPINNFSLYICDDDFNCANPVSGNFSVNHQPGNFTPDLSLFQTTTQSYLECYYEDGYDLRNGSNDVNATGSRVLEDDVENVTYEWYLDTGSGYIQQNDSDDRLVFDSSTAEKAYCSIQVTDVFGLVSPLLNSSEFSFNETIQLWPLADLEYNSTFVVDNNGSNTSDLLEIIGILDTPIAANISLSVFNGFNTPLKNFTSNISTDSTFIRTVTLSSDRTNGSTFILVDRFSGIESTLSAGRYLDFSNHNLTYFERYNITQSAYEVQPDIYRVEISPALEENVSTSDTVSLYSGATAQYPSGWFNITGQLRNGSNLLVIRTNRSGLFGTGTNADVFFDYENVSFTINSLPSLILDQTMLNLSLTDDYFVNSSSLVVTLTNGSDYLYYFTPDTIHNTTAYDENGTAQTTVSCTAYAVNDSECILTIDVSTIKNDSEQYNLSFFAYDLLNKSVGTSTLLTNNSAGLTGSYAFAQPVQNTTNLSFGLLINATQDQNITAIELAVGTAPYPDTGWNVIVPLANLSSFSIENATKFADSNYNIYYDDGEPVINSTDLFMDSSDTVLSAGDALTLFGSSQRYNCTASTDFNASCYVINDTDLDGLFNSSVDTVLYNASPLGTIAEGANLTSMSSPYRFFDANGNTVYDSGEAIFNSSDASLDNISLELLVNATNVSFTLLLSTGNLSLTNNDPYRITVSYYTNTSVLRSDLLSTNPIIYRQDYVGNEFEEPLEVVVYDLNATTSEPFVTLDVTYDNALQFYWTESIPGNAALGETISHYEYALGTEPYPFDDWNSVFTLTETPDSIGRSIIINDSIQSELVTGTTYYLSVRSKGSFGLYSEIASSNGIIYNDLTPPLLSLVSVGDIAGPNPSVVTEQDPLVAIIQADENLSECGFSESFTPFDANYQITNECNSISSTNQTYVTCNLTDPSGGSLTEDSYTFYISCLDVNQNANHIIGENPTFGFSFDYNFPEIPVVNNATVLAYDTTTNTTFERTDTYRNDTVFCTYDASDPDNDSIVSAEYSWYRNGNLLAAYETSSTLNLSKHAITRAENVSCLVTVTDSTGRDSVAVFSSNNSVNNSPPVASDLLSDNNTYVSSSFLLRWSYEADIDSDDLNYTLFIQNKTQFTSYSTVDTISNIASPQITYNYSLASLADGEYAWFVMTCDNSTSSNNCTNSTEYHVFTKDSTGPVIEILAPQNASNNGKQITVIADVEDSQEPNVSIGLVTAELRNATDSIVLINLSENNQSYYEGIINTTAETGNYTLQVNATDSLGNMDSYAITVFVDTSRPILQVDWPPYVFREQYLNDDFMLNLTAYNGSQFNYSITPEDNASNIIMENQTIFLTDQTFFQFNETFSIAGLDDGKYNITFTAVDEQENAETRVTWFAIDTAPPLLGLTNLTQAVYKGSAQNLTLEWYNNSLVPDDNQYGVATVVFYYNISEQESSNVSALSYSTQNYSTVNISEYQTTLTSSLFTLNSEYIYWYSCATDYAGNSACSPTYELALQNRPPVLQASLADVTLYEEVGNDTIYLSTVLADEENESLVFSGVILPEGTLFYDSFDNTGITSALTSASSSIIYTETVALNNATMIVPSHSNLLSNPGLEGNEIFNDNNGTYIITIPSGWTPKNNVTYNNTLGLYNYSLFENETGGVRVSAKHYFYQDIPVTAGTTYSLSAYMRSEGASGTGRLHINWLNSSNDTIETTVNVSTNLSRPALTSTWDRYNLTVIAPTNAQTARVFLDSDNNDTFVYMDNIIFETGNLSYFMQQNISGQYLTYESSPQNSSYDYLSESAGSLSFFFLPFWSTNESQTNTSSKYIIDASGSGSSDNFEIYVTDNYLMTFEYGNMTLVTSINWSAYEVEHLTFTWSPTSIAYYENGSLVAQNTTGSASAPTIGSTFTFGADSSTNNQISGAVDELIIFSSQKNSTQVLEDRQTVPHTNTTNSNASLYTLIYVNSSINTNESDSDYSQVLLNVSPVNQASQPNRTYTQRAQFFGFDGQEYAATNMITVTVVTDDNIYVNVTVHNSTTTTLYTSSIIDDTQNNITSSELYNVIATRFNETFFMIRSSFMNFSEINDSSIDYSTINLSSVNFSSINESSTVNDSSINGSTLTNSIIHNSTLINNVTLVNTTVLDSTLQNVELINSFIDPSVITNVTGQNHTIFDSTVILAEVNHTYIENATVTNSTVDGCLIGTQTSDNGEFTSNLTIENATLSGVYDSYCELLNGTVTVDQNGTSFVFSTLAYGITPHVEDIWNITPNVSLETVTNGTPIGGPNISITLVVDDENLNSTIDDSINVTWTLDFASSTVILTTISDVNASTLSNGNLNYDNGASNETTFNVSVLVEDEFGNTVNHTVYNLSYEYGTSFECNDGMDNDGDGLTDYPADSGCSSAVDTDESNCGDLMCEGSETCSTCSTDCGTCPAASTSSGGGGGGGSSRSTAHCKNRKLDRSRGEIGIDCGGRCGSCELLCTDGILNGLEEEIDCGGGFCNECGASSITGFASFERCSNGRKDNGEVGIDCGGLCTAECSDIVEVTTPTNDGSGAASCRDGVQNGDETGVDCGGSCRECGDSIKNQFDDFAASPEGTTMLNSLWWISILFIVVVILLGLGLIQLKEKKTVDRGSPALISSYNPNDKAALGNNPYTSPLQSHLSNGQSIVGSTAPGLYAKQELSNRGPVSDSIIELEKYIIRCLDSGMNTQKISSLLLYAGWSKAVSDVVLHKIMLSGDKLEEVERFIAKQFAKGRTDEQIKAKLVNEHWSDQIADLIISDVHKITNDKRRLSEYIHKKNLEGHTFSEIEQMLVSIGWNEHYIKRITGKHK